MCEAAFDEDFERPHGFARDRIAGSAIGPRGHATGVADGGDGAPGVVGELGGGETVDELMGITMTRDLMAGCVDRAHHGGLLLGDPAQDEESGLNSGLLEK